MEKHSSTGDSVQFLEPEMCLVPKRRRKKRKRNNKEGRSEPKSMDSSSSFSELPSENSGCLPSTCSDKGNSVVNTCDVAYRVAYAHDSSSSWSPVKSPESVTNHQRNQERKHSKVKNSESAMKSLHFYKNEITYDNSMECNEKKNQGSGEQSPINRSFRDSYIDFINSRQYSVNRDLDNSSSTCFGGPGVPQISLFVGETNEVLTTETDNFTTKKKEKKKEDFHNSPSRLREVGCYVLSPKKKKNVNRLSKQLKLSVSSENIVSPKKVKKMANNSDYSISTPKKQYKQQDVENTATTSVDFRKVTLSPLPRRKKTHISDQSNMNVTSDVDNCRQNLFASNVSPILCVDSRNRKVNRQDNNEVPYSTASMNENTVETEMRSESSKLTQKKKKKKQLTDSNAAIQFDSRNNLISSSCHKRKRKQIESDGILSVIERTIPDLLTFNSSPETSLNSNYKEIDGTSPSFSSPVNTTATKMDSEHTVLAQKKRKKKRKKERAERNTTIVSDLINDSSISTPPRRKKKRKPKETDSITSITFDPDLSVLMPITREETQQQTENNARIHVDTKNDSLSRPKKRRRQNADITSESVDDNVDYDLFSSDSYFLPTPLKSQRKLLSTQVNEDTNDYDELLKEALHEKSEQKNSKEIFEDLRIVLNHDIPRLHLVDVRPCCPPRNEEKEMLKALGWKQGPFNKFEDLILMANWEKFSKEHKILDPTVLLDMRRNQNSNLKREFLQYLGNGLQYRALYQVYHRLQLLCCPKKGLFTKAEDKLILKVVASTPEPYSTLSRVLKRHKHAIYKRYRMLKDSAPDDNGDTTEKLRWSKDLAETVIKALMKVSQASSVAHLKDAAISADIWRQVGVESGLPHWKLRQYWGYKLHTQLFADAPVCESEVQEKIVLWLHSKKFQTEKEILWTESVNLVPGATTWFMWSMFRRLRTLHGAAKFNTLRDFVNALYEHRSILNIKPRYLTRYEVNDDWSLNVINDG